MGMKISSSLNFNEFINSVTSKKFLDAQIQKVVDYLEKKYNEEFEVLGYGDREDYYNDDIKIICTPKSNPNVIFYARGNSLEQYEDNYYIRIILSELEQAIKEEFGKNNYNINIKVDNVIKDAIYDKTTLKEYIDSNEEQLMIAYIVINGEIDSALVKQIIDTVKSNYEGIKLKCFVYRMNQINFDNYCKYSANNESTTRTIIQKYLPSKLEVVEE